MKHLFVGGGADGTWRDVIDGREYIQVPKPIDIAAEMGVWTGPGPRHSMEYEVETYKRHTWTGHGGVTWYIYAIQGLGVNEVMQMLLIRYGRKTV